MSEDATCSKCLFMNPSNGYCRRHGRYVNALGGCRGFAGEEERIEPMKKLARGPRNPSGRIRRIGPAVERKEKICASCGRLLPIELFVRNKNKYDGHDCYCRECFNAKCLERKKKRKYITHE